MNLIFSEVTDNNLLEKVFEFRYKILLEIYPEYLKNLNLKEKKEQDEYDAYSIHFVGLNDNNEICATVRLIYNSPIGYPTENYMNFNNNIFEKKNLGEISRIFIGAKYRKKNVTKVIIHNLMKLIQKKMLLEDIKYTYGSLKPNFLRLLKIYKLNYITLDKEQMHKYFGLRYPCILYTNQIALESKS